MILPNKVKHGWNAALGQTVPFIQISAKLFQSQPLSYIAFPNSSDRSTAPFKPLWPLAVAQNKTSKEKKMGGDQIIKACAQISNWAHLPDSANSPPSLRLNSPRKTTTNINTELILTPCTIWQYWTNTKSSNNAGKNTSITNSQKIIAKSYCS